jgi:transcriptional regulator with XRE-family HTH domain
MPIIPQLIAAREAQGLSVYALAKRIGVGRILLTRWEQGAANPSLDNATRWAAALNLTVTLTPMYTFDPTPPRGHVQILDASILNNKPKSLMPTPNA